MNYASSLLIYSSIEIHVPYDSFSFISGIIYHNAITTFSATAHPHLSKILFIMARGTTQKETSIFWISRPTFTIIKTYNPKNFIKQKIKAHIFYFDLEQNNYSLYLSKCFFWLLTLLSSESAVLVTIICFWEGEKIKEDLVLSVTYIFFWMYTGFSAKKKSLGFERGF